jgi:hypothetical protein
LSRDSDRCARDILFGQGADVDVAQIDINF